MMRAKFSTPELVAVWDAKQDELIALSKTLGKTDAVVLAGSLIGCAMGVLSAHLGVTEAEASLTVAALLAENGARAADAPRRPA